MNESFYYPNYCLQKYLIELNEFTEENEPLLIVTGERGMGKTALLSAFYLSGEAPADMLVCKGRDTLTAEKLISKLIQEWHLDNPPKGSTQSEMLTDILRQMQELPAPALLVIDNADQVPIATLAAIMYLCVLQKDERTVLQFILFGKPSFQKIINSLHQPDITFNTLQLAPMTLEETKIFLDETVKSMQPLNMPELSQATAETIYQQSLGVPRDIAHLAEEQLHPEHFENQTTTDELTITEADIEPDMAQTTKDEHPLDLVKPTKPNTGEKSFWDKYGVKLLSLILLILVFVFLHQYENKIQHENIGYTAPLDSKPTITVPDQQPTPSQIQQPPAQPVSPPAPKPIAQPVKPAQPAQLKPAPTKSSIQITKDKPAPAETNEKPAAKSNDSYHWQLMASPKQTVINQALKNPALKDLDPYMLSKQVHGKTWYTLNIGKFSSKAQAQTMLKNAPAAVLKHKPWLVTTKSKR